MPMIFWIAVGWAITVCLSLYVAIINYQKVVIYERAIDDFYIQATNVLNIMRAIDSRKMFESDDDVGTVFSELVDTINQLRPLVYGADDDKEKN
jgi:hypothetical protein